MSGLYLYLYLTLFLFVTITNSAQCAITVNIVREFFHDKACVKDSKHLDIMITDVY